jgi:hypothetical protein
MPQNWSVSSCTSIWEVRVQSHGAAVRMRAPSYVNHVVCGVASGAFSLRCSNLFLVINIWLIVLMWPYVYAHIVVVRDWAWSCVYLRLERITVLSELPTKRLKNSWCNLLAYIEWKGYINVISTATWLPSHVWRGLWPASCSKRSAPAVRMSSFWINSISYTYHFVIVPCMSSTIHDGTVTAAVESAISVRTTCQCISTSRKQGMLSRVFGVARRTDFHDQSSEVNSTYSSTMWLV